MQAFENVFNDPLPEIDLPQIGSYIFEQGMRHEAACTPLLVT